MGPKPVTEGQEYDVTIEEVGAKGDGIARVKNFVIFVAGVQKGDKVRIRVTSVKGRFAVGEVVGAAGATASAGEESEEESEESESEESEKSEEKPEDKSDESEETEE